MGELPASATQVFPAASRPMRQIAIERLACFGLTTPDAAGLSGFYQRALGFRPAATVHRGQAEAIGSGGAAARVTLALGQEIVELTQFEQPGRPYPVPATSRDRWFQHFAIVVSDMDMAYRRLCSVAGWTAISVGGPQRLPHSSGGVTAFKFRDPDAHPLELLAFPHGNTPARWKAALRGDPCLGIDHSAISVADSARSRAFYQALGLRVTGGSLNGGSEQERLDAIPDARVEVTALTPRQATPHVELLCYLPATPQAAITLHDNDVAATRLIFAADRASAANPIGRKAMIDPDGHHLVLVDRFAAAPSAKATADAGLPPVSAKPE